MQVRQPTISKHTTTLPKQQTNPKKDKKQQKNEQKTNKQTPKLANNQSVDNCRTQKTKTTQKHKSNNTKQRAHHNKNNKRKKKFLSEIIFRFF